MISLLLISHSANIARGVKELADQMVQGKVPIGAAGGTLDGGLGTSTDVITQALAPLRSSDGILVLVDLGSAVMSAEMALEMSGERYLISRAALVEGALVAAVHAATGASLEQVAAAAERALDAKIGVDGAAPASAETPLETPAETLAETPVLFESVLSIGHSAGLHMRPATLFVRIAATFESKLRVRNLDRPTGPTVDAKSMIGIMKLGVAQGHRIHITAEGNDAQEALAALEQLVARNFNE